ncbi:hypothetical protein ACHAXR_002791 [Thalassiosira sp. AJA248-18]
MGRAIVVSSTKIIILSIAGLFAGYCLGRWSTKNKAGPHVNVDGGAFVLVVNLKFSALVHRDAFLKLIEPVCKDVRANEGPSSTLGSSSGSTETTLSYQVLISDKDPLMVMLLERYSDKERGYLEVHKSGSEFLKFRDHLKSMQDTKDVVIEGQSYLETDLGFV